MNTGYSYNVGTYPAYQYPPRYQQQVYTTQPVYTQPQQVIPMQPQFQTLTTQNTQQMNQALRTYSLSNLPKIRPETLNHRLVEIIDHPAFGEVQHYEIYNPLNPTPDNKHQVYIVEKHDAPIVALGTNIGTGSGKEDSWNNGISHFLEHLIFKGSYTPESKVNNEIKKQLEDVGARINAYTSLDNTFYHAIVPKESFAEAFDIHATMVNNPAIPETELNKERKVVIEEINRSHNDVFSKAMDKMMSRLFPSHTYGMTTLGPKENILSLSRDDILGYHRNNYAVPNRQILVVGDVNPEIALQQIQNSLVKSTMMTPKPQISGNKDHHADMSDFLRKVGHAKPVPQTETETDETIEDVCYTLVGFNGPPASNLKDSAALHLLNIILGTGDSSRLNQDLLEKQHKVIDTGVFANQYKDGMPFIVYSVQKPENTNDVINLVNNELKDLITKGVTPQEVDKAKTIAKYALAGSTESPDDLMMNMSFDLACNSLDKSKQLFEIFETLTPADIQAVAQKYLQPENSHVINIKPKNTDLSSPVQAAVAPEKLPNVPTFTGKLTQQDKSLKLDNGSELIVRENKNANDVSRISTSIVLKGGSSSDEKLFQSSLLAHMMQRGTALKDNEQLSNALETKAIDFGIYPGNDGVVVSGTALPEYKDDLFNLLGEIVTQPRILSDNPAVQQDLNDDLAIQKDLIKDSIKESFNQPSNIAFDNMISAIYPEDHPYGATSLRVLNNIDTLSVNDLKAAYSNLFTPSNMTVSVVGNVDAEQTRQTLSKIFSPLKEHKTATKPVNKSTLTQDIVKTRAKEGISQAEIYKAWKAPSMNDEDRFAMGLLSAVLSSGLNSRLFQEFREKREGLCYSVHADHSAALKDGLIKFYVGTSPENINTCLDLFSVEAQKLVDTPVTADELKRAKLLVKTSLMLGNTSVDSVSEKLAFHRAFNTFSTEEVLAKLEQITPADIQKAAQKYFTQPSVTSVVAPKQALLDAGLSTEATTKSADEEIKQAIVETEKTSNSVVSQWVNNIVDTSQVEKILAGTLGRKI